MLSSVKSYFTGKSVKTDKMELVVKKEEEKSGVSNAAYSPDTETEDPATNTDGQDTSATLTITEDLEGAVSGDPVQTPNARNSSVLTMEIMSDTVDGQDNRRDSGDMLVLLANQNKLTKLWHESSIFRIAVLAAVVLIGLICLGLSIGLPLHFSHQRDLAAVVKVGNVLTDGRPTGQATTVAPPTASSTGEKGEPTEPRTTAEDGGTIDTTELETVEEVTTVEDLVDLTNASLTEVTPAATTIDSVRAEVTTTTVDDVDVRTTTDSSSATSAATMGSSTEVTNADNSEMTTTDTIPAKDTTVENGEMTTSGTIPVDDTTVDDREMTTTTGTTPAEDTTVDDETTAGTIPAEDTTVDDREMTTTAGTTPAEDTTVGDKEMTTTAGTTPAKDTTVDDREMTTTGLITVNDTTVENEEMTTTAGTILVEDTTVVDREMTTTADITPAEDTTVEDEKMTTAGTTPTEDTTPSDREMTTTAGTILAEDTTVDDGEMTTTGPTQQTYQLTASETSFALALNTTVQIGGVQIVVESEPDAMPKLTVSRPPSDGPDDHISFAVASGEVAVVDAGIVWEYVDVYEIFDVNHFAAKRMDRTHMWRLEDDIYYDINAPSVLILPNFVIINLVRDKPLMVSRVPGKVVLGAAGWLLIFEHVQTMYKIGDADDRMAKTYDRAFLET